MWFPFLQLSIKSLPLLSIIDQIISSSTNIDKLFLLFTFCCHCSSKKFSKKRFYEEEAELSGSDVGEDDEDLGSEADEYEIDSDIEDLPSDARIQAQVHKAHM